MKTQPFWRWISVCCLALLATPAMGTECFLLKTEETVLQREGECATRHSPYSTFKIPLSLMGYNEGLLIDEQTPVWPYQEAYQAPFEQWKQAQTPAAWMKNSVVWYSQVLTQKMGVSTFKQYVQKFHYGNEDISGDPGERNGLSRSWLSSSLQISPEEQVQFLERMKAGRLPVSKKAETMTEHILWIETLSQGWQLFGKTGTGYRMNAQGVVDKERMAGWFVGWLERGTERVFFAYYQEDEQPETTWAGIRAKQTAKEKLGAWIAQGGYI